MIVGFYYDVGIMFCALKRLQLKRSTININFVERCAYIKNELYPSSCGGQTKTSHAILDQSDVYT